RRGRAGEQTRGRPGSARRAASLRGARHVLRRPLCARAHAADTGELARRAERRARSGKGALMESRRLTTGDEVALTRFVSRIPEGDRTFFKEDVLDAEVVTTWVHRDEARSLAIEAGEVVGTVAVIPLQGWSSHVGEVRVIVDPQYRRRGIGRALARYAVFEALGL